MSADRQITLENSRYQEAKALQACLAYLERSANDAGLTLCAKFINMAAEAATDAAVELGDDPHAPERHRLGTEKRLSDFD